MRYGDNPVADRSADRLNRQAAVQAVLELLDDNQLDTPLALGIFGEWGSGKTSVMKMLYSELPGQHLRLWFDAWHYGHQEETLWRALLLEVVECLRGEVDRVAADAAQTTEDVARQRQTLQSELDELSVTLYRSHEYQQIGDLKVNWQAAIPLALQTAFAFLPAGKDIFDNLKAWFQKDGRAKEVMSLIERERTTVYRDQVRSLEQFQHSLRQLVPKYLSSSEEVGGPTKLFVFIDDLDRCLPEAAVGALEALKLFLDVPGCVFVLGMDRRIVEQGIQIRYQQPATSLKHIANPAIYVDASQYLDKIIQIPFTLPPLAEGQIAALIDGWARDHGDDAVLEHCADLIIAGVSPNPRRVKRTLNVLRLVRALRPEVPPSERKAELQYLAKIVVLQTSYEDVYELIVEDARALKALEAAALNPVKGSNETAIIEARPRLTKMLREGSRFTEMKDEELAALLHAARASHSPRAETLPSPLLSGEATG
jgi:hypothetical protein